MPFGKSGLTKRGLKGKSLDQLEKDPDVGGVVLSSGVPNIFRAGRALHADVAIGVAPQVLLSPSSRVAASLERMHFDEGLSWMSIGTEPHIGDISR